MRVISHSVRWPVVFPQHGPGLKHSRRIVLLAWQRSITTAHPRELIRGLVHSDGSRFVATQRVGHRAYRYARYTFTNASEDIRQIFCDHLDLLGIRWTRPSERHITVATRSDVAALDAFVGPKH